MDKAREKRLGPDLAIVKVGAAMAAARMRFSIRVAKTSRDLFHIAINSQPWRRVLFLGLRRNITLFGPHYH
jgi:hypothetical protein